MKTFFDEKKAVDSMGYFCLKSENNSLNSLKLLKLIYLADRESIKKNGRPIQVDVYRSLRNGPVNFNLRKYISKNDEDKTSMFSNVFIKEKDNVLLKEGFGEEDFLSLSDDDIEVFDEIYKKFGHFSTEELINWTHDRNNIPEWEYNGRTKKINLYEIYEAVGNDKENSHLIADDIISLQEMRISFF